MYLSSYLFMISVFLTGLYDVELVDISGNVQKIASGITNFGWHKKEEKAGDVIFRLYTRDTVNQPEICTGSQQISFKKFAKQKPLKVIIHGWKGHGNSEFIKQLLKAYLPKNDYNIVTVDWSGLGSKNPMYPTAQKKVPEIAFHVAALLDSIHKQFGVKLENVHVIGHSLGAHIAGIAGYLVKTGKIGRITGMDPAGPLFSMKDDKARLSTNSAKFVDVIHTSSNFIGMGAPIGHVDFYPNGPFMLQPGCGMDVLGICSHRRAYFMFAESITNPKAFLAVSCSDWEHFETKDCDKNRVVSMGEYTPTSARGVYYLATNKNSPFGTGTLWTL